MSAQGPVLRVLIVEDTAERQEVLTSLYRAHAWVLVHTAARAERLLRAYEFDLVSLDYNLRGERTGADVARVLLDSPNRAVRVVVHSLNPRGVKEILQTLPEAIPFPVSRLVRSNAAFRKLRERLDAGEFPFGATL